MSHAAFSYRDDPSVPWFPDDRPIIIFDGECVFCSAFARFILRTDRRRRFRLMAAQTPLGIALYSHYGLDPVRYQTNILLSDGRAWLKSEGSIRIFAQLGVPWSLLAAARRIPVPLRDRVYEVVARNRLRWFGTRDTCYSPAAEEADRFVG